MAAELGLILAIAGAVDIGTRVSIDLFDFAQKISSAGKEIRSVATEISLTCSVFESIKNTISYSSTTEHDLTTINTIRGIIKRCQGIFEDIQSVLNNLQNTEDPGNDEPGVDFLKRVEWTFFKRSKVQELRKNLDDMKPVLMLAMMQIQLSHTLGSQSNLVVSQAERAEREHEAKLIDSLNMAQNWSNKKLEERDPVLSNQISSAATIISGATLLNFRRTTPRPVPRTPEIDYHSSNYSGHEIVPSDFRVAPVRRTFTPSARLPPTTSPRPQTYERYENVARARQTVLAAERQGPANDLRYRHVTRQQIQARQLQLEQDREVADRLLRSAWADISEPERVIEQTEVITLRGDRWEHETRISRRL